MLKVFHSEDNLVSKYVHQDQSETSIKVVPSKETNLEAEVKIEDHDKYTVFISASKGCYLKCGFCDLTVTKMPYKGLSIQAIIRNVIEAIEDKVAHYPELKKRYIKLSWMGMGDAFIDPPSVYTVSKSILGWVMHKGYAAGVDGIDLSTSVAKIPKEVDLSYFVSLDMSLKWEYPRNPHNKKERSLFRLFYSLQSGVEATRKSLVPGTLAIEEVIPALVRLKEEGIQIIFHYVVLEGINDTTEQASALVALLGENGFGNEEIRLLRYNPHPDSTYTESSRRFEFAKEIAAVHPNIKLQVSEGEEVRSACGQFMWSQTD